jgi:hypothetical protein
LTDRVLKRRRSQPTVMIWHRHLEHVCHCQRRCR